MKEALKRMSSINLLYYLTYQDFPSNTANSHQTISMCKYFARNNFKVKLFFPLRSSESNDSFSSIKTHYKLFEQDQFETVGLTHNKSFEKYEKFKKINYVLNHILWSKKSVNHVVKNYDFPKLFFTRSDWVFYYLSKKNLKVVYECHQLTKLRKYILRKSIKSENSKIVFLNKNLFDESGLTIKFDNKLLIQENGFDQDFFFPSEIKTKNKVIFSGNFKRFGTDRGINFLVDCFMDERLKEFELHLYGANDIEYKSFNKELKNIKCYKFLQKEQLGSALRSSEIAILINDKNYHSMFYTSPLKFYEYLACSLKILAVDFPSHRILENYGNIKFFNFNDKDSFIKNLLILSKNDFDKKFKKPLNLDERVKNIIKFSI